MFSLVENYYLEKTKLLQNCPTGRVHPIPQILLDKDTVAYFPIRRAGSGQRYFGISD